MKEFFINNRKKVFLSLLEEEAIIILFAGKPQLRTADQFFPFEPNRNFYYLTGIDKPNLIFLAIKNGDKLDETLFIERYDELKAKWDGKTIREDKAREISGIEKIKYLDEFNQIFSSSIFKYSIENIYLDLENRYLEGFREPFNFSAIPIIAPTT